MGRLVRGIWIGLGLVLVAVGLADCAVGLAVSLSGPGRADPGDIESTRDSGAWAPFRPDDVDAVIDEQHIAMTRLGRTAYPYTYYKSEPLEGTHINVDNGALHLRRTIGRPEPSRDARRVFVFGGSAIWGYGVPDSHTVPSLLQKRLGREFDVVNYGELAFTSTQEVHLLVEVLALGNVPDVLVFYDGFNDLMAPLTFRESEWAQPGGAARIRFPPVRKRGGPAADLFEVTFPRLSSYIIRLSLRKLSDDGAWFGDDLGAEALSMRLAEGALDSYEANIRLVRSLAREYGFETFFFWQPLLFSGARHHEFPYERLIEETPHAILWGPPLRLASDVARRRLSGRQDEDIFFFGNLLDDYPEPAFLDLVHVGAEANDFIAEAIYERLVDRL